MWAAQGNTSSIMTIIKRIELYFMAQQKDVYEKQENQVHGMCIFYGSSPVLQLYIVYGLH